MRSGCLLPEGLALLVLPVKGGTVSQVDLGRAAHQ